MWSYGYCCRCRCNLVSFICIHVNSCAHSLGCLCVCVCFFFAAILDGGCWWLFLNRIESTKEPQYTKCHRNAKPFLHPAVQMCKSIDKTDWWSFNQHLARAECLSVKHLCADAYKCIPDENSDATFPTIDSHVPHDYFLMRISMSE